MIITTRCRLTLTGVCFRPEGMRDDVKAFWPRSFFAEEIGGDPGEKNMWWLGSRVRGELTTFVGLLCNKKTTTSVCEGKHYECSYDNQARPDEKNVVGQNYL